MRAKSEEATYEDRNQLTDGLVRGLLSLIRIDKFVQKTYHYEEPVKALDEFRGGSVLLLLGHRRALHSWMGGGKPYRVRE